MTNIERIKQMTAEELATALYSFKECLSDCPMRKGSKHCYTLCAEKDALRKWLESEEQK